MPDLLAYLWNGGLVTSRDRRDLGLGEMQRSTGVEYKVGDPVRAHTIPGRTEAGDTSSAAAVKGLALCLFDSGTNQLFSISGTTLYKGTSPGATVTPASLKTGLNASVSFLTAQHWDDKWYLGDGYGFDSGTNGNLVAKSDDTTYRMGMSAPQTAPTITVNTASAAAVLVTSNDSSSGWTNQSNAQADDNTFSSATLSTATNVNEVWSFASATHTSLKLTVRWGVGGLQIRDDDYGLDDVGAGGGETGESSDFDVDVKIEYSVDGGSAYSTLTERKGITAAVSKTSEQVEISTSGAQIVKVRFTLTYNSGTSPATLRVFLGGKLQSGSTVVATAASTGVLYAVAEYDANENALSPPGPESARAIFDGSTHTSATVTLPAAAQNTRTTHYWIYRTQEAGSVPTNLGKVGTAVVGQTDFIDDLETFDTDERPVPSIPLLLVGQSIDDALPFPRDQEPPALRHINEFQGHLVGTSRDNPRTLPYSVAGRPESWPEVYRYNSIPLPENDRLIGTMTVGELLIVLAEGVIVRMDSLPTVEQNILSSVGPVAIQGAPGVVSEKGFTVFERDGLPLGAWVAHTGIHITDGLSAKRITDEQDWSSILSVSDLGTSVLRWLPDTRQLVFSADSDGGGKNDRYWYIHMDPAHRKSDGLPKITGPHYGEINDLVRGFIGGVERVYSAHVDDGKIYLERSGTTDASGANSSGSGAVTAIPVDMIGPRVYEGDQRIFAKQVAFYHTDFGTGETGTLDLTFGSDFSSEETLSKTVALSGQKETLVWAARSGQWVEMRFRYTGSGSGAIGSARVIGRRMGEEGERVAV